MWSFVKHTWFLGHSVHTNKYNTELAKGSGKGWLMKCECGKEWAR